jgi:hypothetical protein
MAKRAGMIVAASALAVAGAACTAPGRSVVSGTTQYQVCGGAPPPEGVDPCQRPEPVPGTVVVQRGEAVVARVRSDEDGRFRVTLTPGTYTARLGLDPGAPFVDCPAAEIVVPVSAPVTLICRLLAP